MPSTNRDTRFQLSVFHGAFICCFHDSGMYWPSVPTWDAADQDHTPTRTQAIDDLAKFAATIASGAFLLATLLGVVVGRLAAARFPQTHAERQSRV
jgi:hypothetical protein